MKTIQKFTALLLSLAIVFTFGAVGITASANGEADIPNYDVWQGDKASHFADGNGTEGDPWIISNGAELALAIGSGGNGEYYKLTEDIYLNDLDAVDWTDGTYTSETINTWAAYKFSGVIDGNGHVIYGIYINEQPQSYPGSPVYGRGLITRVDGSVTIKNLGIDNIYVNTDGAATAFVGFAGSSYGGHIELSNCFVGENATLKGNCAGSFVAWGNCPAPAEGVKQYAIINSCYSLAIPTGINYSANGLMGAMWGSSWTVNNSYALTNVTLSLNGICANNYSPVQGSADATNVTLVSAENMKGRNPLIHMAGLGSEYVTTDKYPALAIFVKKDNPYSVANLPLAYEGSGTETDPYLISTAADLYKAVGMYGQGKYYKLTNDIYLNDITAIDWSTSEIIKEGYQPLEWFEAGDDMLYNGIFTAEETGDDSIGFYGTIDGNGYSVNGIYYQRGGYSLLAGLIPKTYSPKTATAQNAYTTVKNIVIKHSYIGSQQRTGGIIGHAPWGVSVTLDKCIVDETVAVKGWARKSNDNGVGGLIGYAGSSSQSKINISNCAVYGNVSRTKDFTDSTAWNAGEVGGLFYKANGSKVTVANTVCLIDPISDYGATLTNATFNSLYTQVAPATEVEGIITLTKEQMIGENALDNLAFSKNDWYASSDADKYPMLYVHGLRLGDVDRDLVATANDCVALRMHLIGIFADEKLADVNMNGVTDVCDLVLISLK